MNTGALADSILGGGSRLVTFNNDAICTKAGIRAGTRGFIVGAVKNNASVIFKIDMNVAFDHNLVCSEYQGTTVDERHVELILSTEAPLTAFTVEDHAVSALMSQHQSEGDEQTYVQWLESMVLYGTSFGKIMRETFS